MASDFVEHGYNIRHTLKLITSSTTYARTARSLPGNQSDERFYSHALARPLPPAVLADALADVTGVADRYGELPLGTRAVTLFDPKIPSQALDILGRCSREESCETTAATVSSGGLARKLHFVNGPLINRKITAAGGRLAKLIAASQSPDDIVEEFYLRALGRTPSDAERTFWRREFTAAKTDQHRREMLEDFLWSLLTSRGFVTNH